MSRYFSYLLQNLGKQYALQKRTVLFIVFFSFAIGACGSDDESDTNGSDGQSNTGGSSSKSNDDTSGVGGSESEGGSDSEIVSGVDPENPCEDPTVYTLNDLQSLKECTSISKGLEISQEADDIEDLSGLTNLETVEGNLAILAPNLNSVQGLSNLTSVTGRLTIMAPRLTTLEGLNNLVSVGGLYLNNCEALTDLSGLSSLTSVDGDMSIYNDDDTANEVLSSLDGLSNLTSVNGTLLILNIRSVPRCEVDALFDRLSLDKDSATICGTAKDECGGGQTLCDIQT